MPQQQTTDIRIVLMSRISEAGLSLFGTGYVVGNDLPAPDVLIARNVLVNTCDFPTIFAVARAGIGVDKISIDHATKNGICVFNTPGGNAQAVAELVMTMIGAESRKIFEAVQFSRTLIAPDSMTMSAEVERRKSQFVGRQLAGKSLGVIGLGRIGVLVANLGV